MRRKRKAWQEDLEYIEASYNRVADELAETRRELAKVTAQRDELRRVTTNIRSYIRQETETVVSAAASTVIQRLRAATAAGPPPARSDKIGTPSPSGPVHFAAHLQDPADPSHTGTMGPTD